MKNKVALSVFLFIFMGVVSAALFFPLESVAQPVRTYETLTPLPLGEGGATTSEVVLATDGSGFSDFINGLLVVLVAIAGGLAVLMLVAGGIKIITSESGSGRSQGKDYVKNALGGLLLALGAFVILNTINPDILNIRALYPLDINLYNIPNTPGWYYEKFDETYSNRFDTEEACEQKRTDEANPDHDSSFQCFEVTAPNSQICYFFDRFGRFEDRGCRRSYSACEESAMSEQNLILGCRAYDDVHKKAWRLSYDLTGGGNPTYAFYPTEEACNAAYNYIENENINVERCQKLDVTNSVPGDVGDPGTPEAEFCYKWRTRTTDGFMGAVQTRCEVEWNGDISQCHTDAVDARRGAIQVLPNDSTQPCFTNSHYNSVLRIGIYSDAYGGNESVSPTAPSSATFENVAMQPTPPSADGGKVLKWSMVESGSTQDKNVALNFQNTGDLAGKSILLSFLIPDSTWGLVPASDPNLSIEVAYRATGTNEWRRLDGFTVTADTKGRWIERNIALNSSFAGVERGIDGLTFKQNKLDNSSAAIYIDNIYTMEVLDPRSNNDEIAGNGYLRKYILGINASGSLSTYIGEQEIREILKEKDIYTNRGGEADSTQGKWCTTMTDTGCTNVGGLRNETINRLVQLRDACTAWNGGTACSLTITGGTEWWMHGNRTIGLRTSEPPISDNNTNHKPESEVGGGRTVDVSMGQTSRNSEGLAVLTQKNDLARYITESGHFVAGQPGQCGTWVTWHPKVDKACTSNCEVDTATLIRAEVPNANVSTANSCYGIVPHWHMEFK